MTHKTQPEWANNKLCICGHRLWLAHDVNVCRYCQRRYLRNGIRHVGASLEVK